MAVTTKTEEALSYDGSLVYRGECVENLWGVPIRQRVFNCIKFIGWTWGRGDVAWGYRR